MDNNTHAILFVDDEEKARKMFSRLFSPHYQVLMAADVNEAMQILDKEHANIGVLVTDQRMPGLLGVDLLRHVRKEHPGILRILTTAYSDLDDAIEAVNTGEIFRYINKPWNADDLLMDLRLAMNFFHLQQDRQQLIEEKLSVSQRRADNATITSLICLVSAQPDSKQRTQAIQSLLQQLAAPYSNRGQAQQAAEEQSSMWGSDITLTKALINIGGLLAKAGNNYRQVKGYLQQATSKNWNALLHSCANASTAKVELVSILDASTTTGTNEAIELALLAAINTLASGKLSVKVSAQDDDTLISLDAELPGSWVLEKFANMGSSQYDQQLAELLAMFLYIYHIGGRIQLGFENDKLANITMVLPNTPSETQAQPISDEFWIEDLFINFA